VIFLLIIFYIHRISVYIWFWPTLEMCVPYARAARVCRVVPIKYAKAPDKKGWPEPYIYTPYMTVYLVISLPKIPYTHRIYMTLNNPILLKSSYFCMTHTFGCSSRVERAFHKSGLAVVQVPHAFQPHHDLCVCVHVCVCVCVLCV